MSTATSHLVCVSLPDYAIQLLQREHGIPAEQPLVSVPSERPSARIVHCSQAARDLGIRPGMSYAQALNLSGAVRAAVITADARRRAEQDLRRILEGVAPSLEFAEVYDGAVWIDTRGLFRLFGGAGPWLRRLGAGFRAAGWQVRAVRGWTRAGTLAAAIQALAPQSFVSPVQEEAWLRAQSLEVFPLAVRDREHLRMLGLTDIGRFLDMPETSIARRFSVGTLALHRFLASGLDTLPVQQLRPEAERRVERRIEPPVGSLAPVLRVVAELLAELLKRMQAAGLWIEALHLTLSFEREEPLEELVRCGHATRDHAYLQRLLDARCEGIRLSRRFVTRVQLEARPSEGQMRQEELPLAVAGTAAGGGGEAAVLLTVAPERLDRSLALLQAELGAAALARIHPTAGRFPEERYEVIPLRAGRALLGSSRRAGEVGPGIRSGLRPDLHPGPRSHAGPGRAPGPAGDRPVLQRVRILDSGGRSRATAGIGRRVAGPYPLASAWWRGCHELRYYAYHVADDGTLWWVYRSAGHLHIQGWVA